MLKTKLKWIKLSQMNVARKRFAKILTESCHYLLSSFCFQRIFGAINKNNNRHNRQVNLLIEYDKQNSIAHLMRHHSVMSHAVESSICFFLNGLSIGSKTAWAIFFMIAWTVILFSTKYGHRTVKLMIIRVKKMTSETL